MHQHPNVVTLCAEVTRCNIRWGQREISGSPRARKNLRDDKRDATQRFRSRQKLQVKSLVEDVFWDIEESADEIRKAYEVEAYERTVLEWEAQYWASVEKDYEYDDGYDAVAAK